jgi:hypothetical protein
MIDLFLKIGLEMKVFARTILFLIAMMFFQISYAAHLRVTSVPLGSHINCTDNDDQETDHSCVVKVFVIVLNGDATYACDVFLDYDAFHSINSNKKIKWKIKNAQKGDQNEYVFDVSKGIDAIDPHETDDFGDKAVDDANKRDKFHWVLKPHDQNTKTPKHYQINVLRKSDGKPCRPQDPIIVNES